MRYRVGAQIKQKVNPVFLAGAWESVERQSKEKESLHERTCLQPNLSRKQERFLQQIKSCSDNL